jgi:hypothetical protein
VPLDGTYSGTSGAYAQVRLTVTESTDVVIGSLLLRDGSGATVFDGPVAGPRVDLNRFEVTGDRAPSVGGGTVVLQGTKSGTGIRVTLTSSWLASTTLTLTRQGGA